jgi:hydrocephalus-inducing protein
MNLFGKAPLDINKKISKNYINYFKNLPDKKYFNNNIQVINNYNFYNYEGKKGKDNIEDNIINKDNNKEVDSNKQKYLIKKTSKKYVNETYLISGKSDNANPPLKKKKEYHNDEVENTEYGNKSPERKIYKRKKSIKNNRNNQKNDVDETPKNLISYNQSFKNSKNEENSEINQISKKIDQTINNDSINKKFKRKKRKNKNLKNNNNNTNNNKNIKYIDEELNRMDYEDAIISDKRSYWQYYYSLLKKKHLIILTFIANNDYNVFILKFSLFIISLTLFLALNTLFFRDSSMQQIFIDQGKFRLIYQIPQILYSTLISSIMTFILKQLSLSQNELIKIKREPDKAKSKK